MPDEILNDSICKAHSGIIARIKNCEDDVKTLWSKWDGMQKMTLGIFITLSLNLIAVVFLLLRTL